MVDLNGDFESTVSPWSALTGGSIARQTTTSHTGIASANVTTGGADRSGAQATQAGDAAQNSTWDFSGYLQAHAAGDVGKTAALELNVTGGSGETFASNTVTLAAGWQLATVTAQFVLAGHTAALLYVKQVGAGAAFNFDVDTVQLARHLTYIPAGDPRLTHLWVPGVPAGNYSEPSDARTAQLIASALYAGA